MSAKCCLAAVAGPPRRWRPHPSNSLMRRRVPFALDEREYKADGTSRDRPPLSPASRVRNRSQIQREGPSGDLTRPAGFIQGNSSPPGTGRSLVAPVPDSNLDLEAELERPVFRQVAAGPRNNRRQVPVGNQLALPGSLARRLLHMVPCDSAAHRRRPPGPPGRLGYLKPDTCLGFPPSDSRHIDLRVQTPWVSCLQSALHADQFLDGVVAMRPIAGTFTAQETARCPAQDGLGGDTQEERGIACAVPAPGRRLRRRQPEPASNAHDAVQELVLVSLPHVRPELPARKGVELFEEPVVLIGETLVGGVVEALRAGHLEGLCRNQEITPLGDGSFPASTAWSPRALKVKQGWGPSQNVLAGFLNALRDISKRYPEPADGPGPGIAWSAALTVRPRHGQGPGISVRIL